MKTMRWPFREWSASLVLTGHDHICEHFTIDDVTYIVDGLGGAVFFPIGVPADRSVTRFNDEAGELLIESEATSLRAGFQAIDCHQIDPLTLGGTVNRMRPWLGLVLGLACAGAPRKAQVHAPSPPIAGPAQAEPQPEWQPTRPSSKDSDGDGVADNLDLCPNDPEDRDGFEDGDGCPDPDNDKDRIPDVDDKCPNMPETYNGFEDDDGCPDRGPMTNGGSNYEISATLVFDRGGAAPTAYVESTLDAIAATIRGQPNLLIEVQGHASVGEPRVEALALARAVGIRDALVKRGVSADRLVARGYGTRQPVVCPTITVDCPEQLVRMNRRVELKTLKWIAPTGSTGEGP
jgi:outer membrane protein OmpA-like peptidoglycan-associated protein